MGVLDWIADKLRDKNPAPYQDPGIPEDLVRVIWLKDTSPEVVREQLTAYEGLNARGTRPFVFRLSEVVDRWMRVEVDRELHVFHFHNLALWFLGMHGQVGVARKSIVWSSTQEGSQRWSYVLVPDANSTLGDSLKGQSFDGNAMHVYVPEHKITRMPADKPLTPEEFLEAFKFPPSLLVPLPESSPPLAAQPIIQPWDPGTWGNPGLW